MFFRSDDARGRELGVFPVFLPIGAVCDLVWVDNLFFFCFNNEVAVLTISILPLIPLLLMVTHKPKLRLPIGYIWRTIDVEFV